MRVDHDTTSSNPPIEQHRDVVTITIRDSQLETPVAVQVTDRHRSRFVFCANVYLSRYIVKADADEATLQEIWKAAVEGSPVTQTVARQTEIIPEFEAL